jgi:hypothetical protein
LLIAYGCFFTNLNALLVRQIELSRPIDNDQKLRILLYGDHHINRIAIAHHDADEMALEQAETAQQAKLYATLQTRTSFSQPLLVAYEDQLSLLNNLATNYHSVALHNIDPRIGRMNRLFFVLNPTYKKIPATQTSPITIEQAFADYFAVVTQQQAYKDQTPELEPFLFSARSFSAHLQEKIMPFMHHFGLTPQSNLVEYRQSLLSDCAESRRLFDGITQPFNQLMELQATHALITPPYSACTRVLFAGNFHIERIRNMLQQIGFSVVKEQGRPSPSTTPIDPSFNELR